MIEDILVLCFHLKLETLAIKVARLRDKDLLVEFQTSDRGSVWFVFPFKTNYVVYVYRSRSGRDEDVEYSHSFDFFNFETLLIQLQSFNIV